MRVLVLNHNLVERGTYFRALMTAKEFHRRGHDVTFATTGPQYYRAVRAPARPRWRGVRTANWTPFAGVEEALFPLGLAQRLVLAAERHDLVYAFVHKPVDHFPARLARARGAFWLQDWCDLWSSNGGLYDMSQWPEPHPDWTRDGRRHAHRALQRWEERLEERSARDADAVTIISSWMRGETRRLGVPDDRVHLYGSGADTRRVAVLDKVASRVRLGVPAQAPMLGYAANYSHDSMMLEEALERVWRARPDAFFLTAGPRFWRDGGPIARALAEGRAMDRGRVPFSEIPAVLGASDALVLPMRDTRFNWSRWPHKFGDYLAAGRPVAITRIGDCARDVEEHRLGAVGAPTADGLAAALLDVLARRDEWAAMGARARRLAETSHSWPARFEGLADFLRGKGLPV